MTRFTTVYSTWLACNATFRAFDARGIEYEAIDVTVDPDAHAHVKALGYRQAPVVEIGDDHWSGFRPDKIDALAEARDLEF